MDKKLYEHKTVIISDGQWTKKIIRGAEKPSRAAKKWRAKKRVVIKKTVYESSIGVTKLTPGAEIYIVLPLGLNELQHWCHNFCTNFILHINHGPENNYNNNALVHS